MRSKKHCNFRGKLERKVEDGIIQRQRECNLPFGPNYCTQEKYKSCQIRGYALEKNYRGSRI